MIQLCLEIKIWRFYMKVKLALFMFTLGLGMAMSGVVSAGWNTCGTEERCYAKPVAQQAACLKAWERCCVTGRKYGDLACF
jgi:hypothetical protein